MILKLVVGASCITGGCYLLLEAWRRPPGNVPTFRLRHLLFGERTMAESSRGQLLVEGLFGIALGAAALVFL
jgi:hypothetical protein